jgi:hypothetical protein
LAPAWRQREIGGGGNKAAPRHGGGVAAAQRHHQWRQRRRWGRMTKAAAVMVYGGEKKLFCRFLNFDVWRGGSLSGRPFCSRRIPRVRFLSEQSYIRVRRFAKFFPSHAKVYYAKVSYLHMLRKMVISSPARAYIKNDHFIYAYL